MKTGIELIAEERQRQIDVEGYDQEHDAQHHYKEFINAAAAYLLSKNEDTDILYLWPFDISEFKSTTEKSNLIKAGALIAAALDRLNQEELENNNNE